MSQNTQIALIAGAFILTILVLASFKPGNNRKLSQSALIDKMTRDELEQLWNAQSGVKASSEILAQWTDAELRAGLKTNIKSNFCCG